MQPIKTRKRFKIKDVKWEKWAKELPELRWDDEEPLNQSNLSLIEAIKSSEYKIQQTSGMYCPRFNKPWWNDECAKLSAIRKKMKKKFCQNQTAENFQNMRHAENKAKHYINYQKKKSWQEHASTLTSSTPLTSVWNQVRVMRNRYSPTNSAISHRDKIYTIPADISEILVEHFEA